MTCDMKRSLRRLLFPLSLALCLCGCGGGVAPPAERDGATAGTVAEAGASVGKADYAVTLSFWFAANGAGETVMREILDDFNSSHRDYHVEGTVFGGYEELGNAVTASFTTGTAPDIVLLERDMSIDLRRKGLNVDLTQILQRDINFNARRFLSVYYDQGVSEDGKIFAMPLYGTTQVLYYNKKAFREANIDPESIRTWQDLAAAARAIQDTGNYDYGWEPMWGYENMTDAALSNGGAVFSPDGRTVTINAPEWVEVWDAFRKYIHEERIMRVHSGGYGWEYWNYTRNDALQGVAGGYTGSSGDQADVDFELVGMMEQPAWREGLTPRPGAKALLLNVLSTSAQEKQIGAYALIRYLIDVPAQVRWTMGTGYIAVNQDILKNADYQKYLSQNQHAQTPLNQSAHASAYPYDPTGGVIRQALQLAADQVQIENLSAQKALDEAQRKAQQALDALLSARPPETETAENSSSELAETENRNGGAEQ